MLLEAHNLQFAYAKHQVLRDVSLTLAAGEVVALLGPNGSGKSTLIRVLLGQLHGSGTIRWNGREIRSWRRRDLARLVAYLPQSPAANFEQRALDVLRAGRAPYWGAFGIESAKDAHVVGAIPQQLELTDLLDRPMAELSGGQRQLVFLGRCLVQEPAALLLDEPGTFLDLRHQVELIRLLRKLAATQHLGILMASHDLNLSAAWADRVILLHQGKVLADDSPDQVLRPELLTQAYGVELRRADLSVGIPLIYPAGMLQSRRPEPV